MLEIPVHVVDVVMRWEQVEQPHTVLAGEPRWYTPDEQRRVDRAALAELDARGLLDNGAVDEEFRAWMGVLARPSAEFYGWLTMPDGLVGVLVASGPGLAVLAVREEETLWLRGMRPESLAETLVRQLPEVPPGRGRSINVAESELDADQPEATRLASLLAEPRSSVGQLCTAVRDELGRRHRTTRPLTYLDVTPDRPAHGRWMTQSHAGWVIAAPAGEQALVTRLNEMHRELVG
ncbi:ESX secretion-associated protein EspG [Kutzneria albida]|uniref:ESX secretion-associated protein EspG n=1 Tax=Kutzneria albida DSM 43870 TaxID=1449976 RepID=W5WGS1_9PSEU|nr:ESX secretion-associated protein EspG [Kutzneria albida]AHI00053.1 hypothetical protein KALB_6694 [Kutzneria albida DSM 43870]